MIRRDRFNWVDIGDLASATLLNPNATQTEQTLASFIKDNRIIERIDEVQEDYDTLESLSVTLEDLDKFNETELREALKDAKDTLDRLSWYWE